MSLTEADLIDILSQWDPEQRPEHCSNCGNTRVHGDPADPQVRCTYEMGRGKPISLWRLVRQKAPLGFISVRSCGAFKSMSEE